MSVFTKGMFLWYGQLIDSYFVRPRAINSQFDLSTNVSLSSNDAFKFLRIILGITKGNVFGY